jgi:hypothetical protein
MRLRRTMLMVLAALLSLPAVMSSPATARQDTGTTEVAVHVNVCVAAGCTELPEAIEPADGVSVTLESVDDGSVLGTCVTGEANPGTCVIALEQVPEAVTVSVDPATVPEGYVADAGTAPYFLQAETPEVWLLLYPEDGILEPPSAQEDPQAPVTEPTVVPPGDDDPLPLPLPIVASFPASLYAGTCADLEAATSAEPLTDLVIVDGEHRGAANALVAASSYSVVPVALDDILAGGYAIGVLDEGQSLIACGDLGGPLDQQGTFSVGLAPVEGSDAAGVAYVAPMGEGETVISAFLVPEGLAPAADVTP